MSDTPRTDAVCREIKLGKTDGYPPNTVAALTTLSTCSRTLERENNQLRAILTQCVQTLEMCREVEGTASASYDPAEYNAAIEATLQAASMVEKPDKCPQCGDPVIHANLGDRVDSYCENCGWPDENRPPEPTQEGEG